jgi:hypothetical protein
VAVPVQPTQEQSQRSCFVSLEKTMFHRWAALLLVLALCAMSPKTAAGQQQSKPRGQGASGLGSYPNPANPEVFLPMDIRLDECSDGSRQHVVTLKIYNVLMQVIATPVLQGASSTSTTPVPPGAGSQPIANMRLGCGSYLGYWNGKLEGTSKEAPSGVYIAQLFIDRDKPIPRRIFFSK